MARLELQQVCKGFDHPVLDRVSLTVEEGEFFVIVGPSGIGKTTLLRCIAGLEVLDAGRVLIGERDVTKVPPYRRKAAMTFESYALYPNLTVYENIASPLRARRLDRSAIDRKVKGVAALLRIGELLDRRPHEISGGQKQRTALGRTLVAEPDVFLLDEPISHLDAKIRHELRLQFHGLEELRRVATVYVTHDYVEALSLGDRVGVMGPGGLVQVGKPREIFERPETVFVARHLGQPSINELPCRLTSGGRGLQGAVDGFSFPVAPVQAKTLNGTRTVTLGIRPQHVRVLTDGMSTDVGEVKIEGKVEVYEALGATGVLVAGAGPTNLTVLTSPTSHFDPGQPVSLALKPHAFMYFDANNGANLIE